MPKGVEGAYKSGYIMGQMKKQGAFSDANEGALHRERLDPQVTGANSGAFEQSAKSSSTSGSAHTKQLGMIMGQSKSHK
tara:strand:+ start:152 stop:388 length:237 start_codon:yes stop_codon:yes gene_type:complete